MKCTFVFLFVSLVQQGIGQNFTEEIVFKSNETALEENFELTTLFSLDSNAPVSFISGSPPVTRILQEIFRTYEPYCWRRTYGRGVGRPLHVCPDQASEQNGLLCYPSCQDGYNGVGPMCWEKCVNLTSFGFICVDISLPKLRACPWYDKCGISQPSCISCPMNYTKIGCLCGRMHLRKNYGRGAGLSLICSHSYERGGALCYKKCDKGYHGIGPVCRQTCPSTHPYSCFAGCSQTKKMCHDKVKDLIQSVTVSCISILNVIIGIPLVGAQTLSIVANAERGQWIFVAKDITILALQLMEKILPELAKKFAHWPVGTIESATKNASLILTATAMNDRYILKPILKYFHIDSVVAAFDDGQCELEFLE